MPSKRRPPDPPAPVIRRFSLEEAQRAKESLSRRLAEVRVLQAEKVGRKDPRVEATQQKIRSTILEVFGANSPEYRDNEHHRIEGRRPTIAIGYGDDPRRHEPEYQRNFEEGFPRTITMLEALIGTVEERTDAPRPAIGKRDENPPNLTSDKVFVVHGRKEGPREAAARFVERLGYKPVILQEQANEGRTIIEKFERHSDVAYAVVLLTADDRGGLIDTDPSTYLPRARQNVILELGYFVGTLGRGRVCVLHEAGVEIPSDFHGVVYVALDPDGAWRLRLAKEMRVAGLDVDLNRAI